VDEVYSYEQLVIDAEIIEYARRVVKGFPFDKASADTKPVKDAGIGGQFLDHPTTVDAFRHEYWFPELFEHPMLATWQAAGARSVVARAGEIARRRIAEYDYAPDRDVRKEIAKIYRSAEAHLLGK
jgi:trimethylamine--corrinoid protein Co-methyltransferase